MTNRLASETRKQFWYSGTLVAPSSEDTKTPRGDMLVTPDCDPEVMIAAPPGVRDRLNVVGDKYLV
jgi:hypothetical protein